MCLAKIEKEFSPFSTTRPSPCSSVVGRRTSDEQLCLLDAAFPPLTVAVWLPKKIFGQLPLPCAALWSLSSRDFSEFFF